METQTQIVSVYTRSTSKGSVYDVNLADGSSKSTWDAATAAALNQYAGTGQVVMLRYDQKPSRDGRFINETITAFAPPGQGLPQEMAVGNGMQPMGQAMQQMGVQPMQGGMQQGVMQSAQPIQPPPPPQAPARGFDDPNVVARITKLACISDACQLVGSLMQGAGPEALQEALGCVRAASETFYGWARSHENAAPTSTEHTMGPQGQVMASQAVSGSQIAQDTPGVALGAPQVVDVSNTDPSEWD